MKTKLAAIVAMAEAFQAKGSIYPDSYPDWAQLRQALDEAHRQVDVLADVAELEQRAPIVPPELFEQLQIPDADDAELDAHLVRFEQLLDRPGALDKLLTLFNGVSRRIHARNQVAAFPAIVG